MIIVNTTFHVPLRLKRILVDWLRSDYAVSAKGAGLTDDETARVLGGGDEEGVSIAFRVKADTLARARSWNEGEADVLRRELLSRYGSNVAYFTTYLTEEK